MKRMLTILLVNLSGPFLLLSYGQQTDSLKVIRLLHTLEAKNKTLRTLSYHSAYRQINSSLDDSMYSAEATVWLKVEPKDTVFGNIFHARGADRTGSFDYYYDGQKSMELRHTQKEINLIDPSLYPNNANNPAKARTSLLPLQELLLTKDLVDLLILHPRYNPSPRVSLQNQANESVIVLAYPVNNSGSDWTTSLFIDKKTGQLTRVSGVSHFNGVIYKTEDRISQLVANGQTTPDSLFLTNAYPDYRTIAPRPRPSPRDTMPLVGKPAPGFTLPTFDGDSLSLAQLKGKYVLLDFWETWCGYCILAFPKMKEAWNRYHDRGLEIVGVTTENLQKIPALIRSNQLPFVHVKGGETILQDYNVTGRPAYVLIDRNGTIAAVNDLDEIGRILDKL